MTCEITHNISPVIAPLVLATGQTCPFSWFLQLPSSGIGTQLG